MNITEKKPPIKQTVGDQYICFNTMTEKGEWTTTFETAVTKTETVKTVKVSEKTDPADVYSSGKKYYSNTTVQEAEIEVETIAFPGDDLAKMRGDDVDEGGLIQSGGDTTRPFFAYGKVVKLTGGAVAYEWYPKCKITENSDSTKTSEDKFKEQTDTIKITAYPFDEKGHVVNKVLSDVNFPDGLTEEGFFSKVIIVKEDLADAVTASSAQQSE